MFLQLWSGKLTCRAVSMGSPSCPCPGDDWEEEEQQSFLKVMRGNKMSHVCNKKMDCS